MSGVLQDAQCTPGAMLNVTAEQVCVSGYSDSVRDVPDSLKRQVYESYGMQNHSPGCCEVDHLISLELGGSNDKSNLWPEFYNVTDGARVKDKIENCLHRLVCDGRLQLAEAQRIMSTDWRAAKSFCGG